MAFPVSPLSASASLFNYFFQIPSSLGAEPCVPPPPTSPVTARTIVKIVKFKYSKIVAPFFGFVVSLNQPRLIRSI